MSNSQYGTEEAIETRKKEVVREMGVSPQLATDFKSTQNDKDLIETQNVQDFNSNKKPSKFPDYAKDYKKEYVFLLGINEAFSYLIKGIGFNFVGYGSLKKVSSWIDKIYIYIKKYKEDLDSGVLRDLSKKKILKIFIISKKLKRL